MWQYRLVDWPLDGSEGDLETWCQDLADDGWILGFAGTGATIEQEGHMVHRISIRRDTSIYGRHILPARTQQAGPLVLAALRRSAGRVSACGEPGPVGPGGL